MGVYRTALLTKLDMALSNSVCEPASSRCIGASNIKTCLASEDTSDKLKASDTGELLAVSASDTEALAALATLGYSVMEAQRALAATADHAPDVESKVMNALRYLGGA